MPLRGRIASLSLLTLKYELFNMEEGEDIQTMFGRFQNILNKLHSLGRHYDNYDHIDKILRTIKNLDSITLEELVGILKVHELELAQDEGTKKGKSLALTIQRPKHNSASKALVVNDASKEESDEEDDELKRKSPIICYECKKLGHFKSECPDIEKLKDKKKKFFKSKRKTLMSTWEDLGNSSSKEESREEANLCLMADASTSKAKPALDASSDDEDSQPDDTINSNGEKLIFKSREDLIKGYNKLLSSSARVSKAYRKLNKHFQHLEIEYKDLKKAHQVVKLYEEIETLRDKLGKFIGGHEALNKIIKVQRNPKDKFSHAFKGKKIVHGEEVIVCYFCGKMGHKTHKCKDLPTKGNPSKGLSSAYQHPQANKEKGPKKIWVAKNKIIPITDLLDSRKETPLMVPGQWLLATHDSQKVYVLIPKPYV
ncbi:hypothetical protein JHK82_034053 [Glycine max]|uniref:CCHC-type domain-containing protein n=1 Tax=Glycine max TaxID=3847 RepID=A0A0R0HGG0_SOYBN|nr:hypothetical protein JHK85_034761 [Glycine max]KAG4986431.1 hypothetical protein JHK86_034122 [Glycine max]KAG5119633.1 hypothetical protein JHK82_034053 [Glycine max]